MKTNLRLIGGKRLQSPKNISTRPTTLRVREAIFNILNNRVENSNWLDLFSGTGAISCEAYNHGARKIVAIEKNKNNSKTLYINIKKKNAKPEKMLIYFEVVLKQLSVYL